MKIPYPWVSFHRFDHFKTTTALKRISWYWTSDFIGFYGRIFGAAPGPEYLLVVGVVW